MKFLSYIDRKIRLTKRKEFLGEKFTSNITSRKFQTQKLKDLNPQVNFEEIESIYQICTCSASPQQVNKIKYLIKNKKVQSIPSQNWEGVEFITDDFGELPTGWLLETFIFLFKNKDQKILLIKYNLEENNLEETSILFDKTNSVEIKKIKTRELVFPI